MGWFKHEQETKRYVAGGKPMACGTCGGRDFIRSEAQLHTQGMTFFHLEWLGQTVHVLICSSCGRIDWFARKPEEAAGA